MKHKVKLALAMAALMMVAVGCGKEKTCRCSVQGSATVRIIKIDGGTCEDLHVFQHHNELDSLKVDSLLCTDHEFAIDSIYK